MAVLGLAAYIGQSLVPEELKSRSNALWAIATGAMVIPAVVLAFLTAWKLRIPEIFSALALAGRLVRRTPLRAFVSRDA